MNIYSPVSQTQQGNCTAKSYLHTLLSHNSIPSLTNTTFFINPSLDILEETEASIDPSNFITLTFEKKTRLYALGKHVVIVKVFG